MVSQKYGNAILYSGTQSSLYEALKEAQDVEVDLKASEILNVVEAHQRRDAQVRILKVQKKVPLKPIQSVLLLQAQQPRCASSAPLAKPGPHWRRGVEM